MNNEIVEITSAIPIDPEKVYRVGRLKIKGIDVIHKVADGIRYEEIREHILSGECYHE